MSTPVISGSDNEMEHLKLISPLKGGTNEGKRRKLERMLTTANKRQILTQEKLSRKAAAEHKKIYKPGTCMKYMNLEIHPSLLEAWYMSDLKRELDATGARLVSTTDHIHPALVTWSRNVSQVIDDNEGKIGLSSPIEHCDMSLYVLTAEEVAELVKTCTLTNQINMMKELTSISLSVVIFGLRDYFKSAKGNRKLMTETMLQSAIIDILVSTGCDTVRVDTPNELALLLVQFTKAIAETPYKKAKRDVDNQATFFMRGDSKKCVAVNTNGDGVSRLWQQMLAVLPSSSLETARALAAKYKSPLELFEALQKPSGVIELADVGVARAAVPGSKSRRIGPEFARKLNTLFTSDDGDVVLG